MCGNIECSAKHLGLLQTKIGGFLGQLRWEVPTSPLKMKGILGMRIESIPVCNSAPSLVRPLPRECLKAVAHAMALRPVGRQRPDNYCLVYSCDFKFCYFLYIFGLQLSLVDGLVQFSQSAIFRSYVHCQFVNIELNLGMSYTHLDSQILVQKVTLHPASVISHPHPVRMSGQSVKKHVTALSSPHSDFFFFAVGLVSLCASRSHQQKCLGLCPCHLCC